MGVYLYSDKWLPGENTLLYYDFEQNMNDLSGNGYNISTSTNVGYAQVGGQYVANATASQPTLTPPVAPFNQIGAGDFAISIMYYVPSWNSSETYSIIAATNENDSTYYPGPFIYFNKATGKQSFRMKNNNILAGPNANTLVGAWHHYVFTRNGEMCAGYIDGNLIGAINDTTSVSSITNAYLRRGSWDKQPSGTKCDKVIVEKVGWNSQNVSNYFNNIKSIYGIS